MAQQGGIAINHLLHISKWLEEKIYLFFFIFEEYALRGIDGIGIDTVELIRGIDTIGKMLINTSTEITSLSLNVDFIYSRNTRSPSYLCYDKLTQRNDECLRLCIS